MDEEMTQVIEGQEIGFSEEEMMTQVINHQETQGMEDQETQVMEEDPLHLDKSVEEGTGNTVDLDLAQSLDLVDNDNCQLDESVVPSENSASGDFGFSTADDFTFATLNPDYEEVTETDDQFPSNQDCQIRIRDLTEICEVEVGHFENNGEQEIDAQGENENLPFPCNLCDQKFKKKLFLNNHMEKRHGIKFVFTERGKKVKLIRMPEELTAGEKLDPCVEALMQQNGQNSSNILGVQSIEQRRRADEFPSAHEVDPHDLLQGKSEREFGAGILVKKIRTFAAKSAEERKETPFVVYRPLRSKRLYLLSIQTLNETTQLLLPTTQSDLAAGKGIDQEPSFYFSHRHPSNPLQKSPAPPGREIIKKPCIKFSHVAVVALAEQTLTLDENNVNKLQIKIHPPPPPTEPCSLIKFQHFARTIIQCRPKRLRCLSFPPKPTERSASIDDAKPRTKRKYTRRNLNKMKKIKKEKLGRKRKRVDTSDEESEIEGGLDTSSSDEENSSDRLIRLSSPQSNSEHVFIPQRLCHPTEEEVLEPPRKKFNRRGRPRKSSTSGLSKQLLRMKLEVSRPESNGEENRGNSDTLQSPPRSCPKKRPRKILRDASPENDQDDEGNDELSPSPSPLPLKKRGRGRPRKYPIQA